MAAIPEKSKILDLSRKLCGGAESSPGVLIADGAGALLAESDICGVDFGVCWFRCAFAGKTAIVQMQKQITQMDILEFT